MAKNLANSNLPEGGQNQSEHKNVNPIIVLISTAILIFLIIGQFFMPITVVDFNGKKKQISLNDFALKDGIDYNDFTTDKMFFLTEDITMKEFFESSNTTLVKYFSDNGISENDLMSNVLDYKSSDSTIKRLFSYEDIITNAFKTDVPLSEFMIAHKTEKITLQPEVITISEAENMTVEQFLKSHDFNFAEFIADAGINSEDFVTNVLNYKSNNDYNLLVDSYQNVIISVFNTNLPMSEYILANHLSKEVLLETGEDATEEDLASGQLTKTVLKAKLTPEQLTILTDNYFKTGFISKDGIITFIVVCSIIFCIASLALFFIGFSKRKINVEKSYRLITFSFFPVLAAKLLAFFADLIVKGEFSGVYGKYTSWTKFVQNLDPSPLSEVHISDVPIHITTILLISILIPLTITIVTIVKNKLGKNNS